MTGKSGEKIENQRLDLLLTEYQETGEEARSRDRLIHNTFYLVLFAVGAFLITEVNALNQGDTLLAISVSVISFCVFLFLSIVIYTYTTYRASQWSRRKDIEDEIHDTHRNILLIQTDAVNKRLPPGQSNPRMHNRIEGLSTKYIAHIVGGLAFLSLLPTAYLIVITLL